MKLTKMLALALAVLMMLGLALTASAEDVSGILGMYTMQISGEELINGPVATFSSHESADSMIGYNFLMLTNNETFEEGSRPTTHRPARVENEWRDQYLYEAGRRYVLTKMTFGANRGIELWISFYGTFDYDGEYVTLHPAEKCSFNYFYGDSLKYQYDYEGWMYGPDDTLYANDPDMERYNTTPINMFSGPYAEYHFNTGNDDNVIELDLEAKTFSYFEEDEDAD